MSDTNEQAQMIEDCEKRESRFSDWQKAFIDSISKQLADGRSLSQKQADKPDEIWEAATARG